MKHHRLSRTENAESHLQGFFFDSVIGVLFSN